MAVWGPVIVTSANLLRSIWLVSDLQQTTKRSYLPIPRYWHWHRFILSRNTNLGVIEGCYLIVSCTLRTWISSVNHLQTHAPCTYRNENNFLCIGVFDTPLYTTALHIQWGGSFLALLLIFDVFPAICSRWYSACYWSASVRVSVVTAVVVYTTVRKLFVTLFVYCDIDKRSRYRRERLFLLVIA